MGRSKSATKPSAKPSTSSPPPSTTVEVSHDALSLLQKAEQILNSEELEDVELAATFVQRARAVVSTEEERLKADEVEGMVQLERGNEAAARKLFKSCSSVSATALLYLAQLSATPFEAVQNFKAAVDLLSKRLNLDMSASQSNGALDNGLSGSNGKSKAWSAQEKESRERICQALVSMTEMYLTHLCFEEDAEARCEEYLSLALRVDSGADLNPEIYSTLASVRLSQQKPEEALRFLTKSYSIWSPLPPESPLIPGFETRLDLIKLFMECSDLDTALEILERLEDENDEDLEVIYLLALVNLMMGDKGDLEEDVRKEAYVCAREALQRFIETAERNPDEVDPEMAEQVKEMIIKLEKEKNVTLKDVEEASRQEGEDDDEGDWVDDDEDNADDGDAVMS